MKLGPRIVGIWLLFCAPVFLPSQTKTEHVALAAGQVIEDVACETDATQSYALYLPSGYTPARRWPIIYAFDPLARGQVPVTLYKDAAEKYGFVLAGSNNSRNFSMAESLKGATAMWNDTHARLALDERRTYATGFSGGARVAGLIATRCVECKIAGVIAHGAGYPSGVNTESAKLPYFLAVGNEDFNWEEVTTIRRQREDSGVPYRVRGFSGPHQWAPPAIMEDALQWVMLRAMQSGVMPPDGRFVDEFFQRTVKEAEEAEKRGDAIAELSAYRLLVSDFHGLKNVAEYEKKLAALKDSAGLKAALKNEQDQMREESRLEQEISPQIGSLAGADVDGRVKLRGDIAQGMAHLKDVAEHDKNEQRRLVFMRAFRGLWAQGIEGGQSAFEQRHFDTAEVYFQLMGECSVEPWPSLLLAETRVAMGNKKQALRDLREAIRRGLKNPEAIERDSKLQSLSSDVEFRKMLAELKAQETPAKQ